MRNRFEALKARLSAFLSAVAVGMADSFAQSFTL